MSLEQVWAGKTLWHRLRSDTITSGLEGILTTNPVKDNNFLENLFG